MDDKKTPKNATIFLCDLCTFKCSKKCDYNRHIHTRKHQKHVKLMTEDDKKTPKNAEIFLCGCGKKYSYRQGLWKHKKSCNFHEINDVGEVDIKQTKCIIDKELVLDVIQQNNNLIKENNEFKQILYETQSKMLELLKNGTQNTTNTNSHNKTFNLQIFLNETCKNAMNITDFVNSLQLQLCDLEKMGDVGYVNGMSNIIIKSLKDMDVTERPVHCTDKKREILYVKDEGTWDKETQNKPRIRKAIKQIARKNALLIQEYKEKYPDCMKSDSPYADTYNKLIIEAMGGKDYDKECQESKIIKNITHEVRVDK